MEHVSPAPIAHCEPMVVNALTQGNARLGDWVPGAREHAQAVPWPEDLLNQFGLRMARHGMSISRTHMLGSPRYALQQMAHARALGDATLEFLVVQLFRCYEAHQSGVYPPSH